MLEFKYHLIDTQGKQKDFIFRIDETELTLLASLPDNLPEWTKLNFHKCPTCTLNESERVCAMRVMMSWVRPRAKFW